MLKKIVWGFLIWPVMLCVLNASYAWGGAKDSSGLPSRESTLVIGRVSDNPRKHFKRLKPIVDYVAARMGDLGIKTGKVLLARDNARMERYLMEGKVDWVTETAISALLFSEKTGAHIILRRWKKGVPDYHTVIFTRKDSGINSLEDLRGKTIAFEDPGSTSAFLVPLAELRGKGLVMERLKDMTGKPGAGKTGYLFAGNEVNVSAWVEQSVADAGALSGQDWSDRKIIPETWKDQLKIIHKTGQFPRAVELARKGLAPGIRARLVSLLLDANKNPEGIRALFEYSKTARFDKITGDAALEMERARRVFKLVRPDMR